ncbi:outer membrane lipoprotein-sorting protein [Clostridium sp. MB40-C1]|uniref:LolA family protein n=1 Tax=Clostridium sp. MB40-C1 TaxID=3070996 RepID=UPI0027DEC8CC|nr:outer membrane lipoprotein-sorting protein [Clostridium sp. MB40-C1]WMJ80943.1 outer membrane lipoprotein-sorting protein [Clostridium sp. MB40-C1]
MIKFEIDRSVFVIMNKNLKLLLSGFAVSMVLFTGCSMGKTSILPKEIVANAMEVNNKPNSYYIEGKILIFENDKVASESEIKEWISLSGEKNKRRSETSSKGRDKTITTNNGEKVVIYMPKDNKALISKVSDNKGLMDNSQRKQAMDMLESMKNTHEISTLGEEDVNGMKAYHLKATPKQKDSIVGAMDIWVDKKNWFIVKLISQNGNSKIQLEYTKVDFSAKFDEKLFDQNLPSNVKIEDLDKKTKENKKKITLKEARKFIGKPILYIEKTSGYDLKEMNLQMYGSKVAADEIIQDYYKNNKKSFSLSTRKEQKLNEKGKEDNTKLPGEKDITIRGKKGMLLDDVIKLITWSESGVSYSFMIEDPNMTFDEAKKVIENMKIMP